MSQLTDEQLQNTNSVIANGLEAKTMRHKIENKDLLSQKGALYVGTGNTTSTGAAVTTSIAPNGGTDDGKILIADSAKIEGWKIDKIGNDNITNGTITGDKLTNGTITGDKLAENFTYITSDTSSFCLQDSSNNSTPRLSFVESNNHASVALRADLKSQELEGKSYTLTLPNENGTVATKEQIENGDIIAKTASSLKGNSSSQNQLFTSKKGTQNWAEFHEQSVLSTEGVTSIQLGPKDLTTSNGIISGTFFTPSVDNLGVGLYVVHDIDSHFFGIACLYDLGDQGEYGYDVALWGGIKMTNGKGTLKANTTLRALKIGWVNSLTSAANVFNALGLV